MNKKILHDNDYDSIINVPMEGVTDSMQDDGNRVRESFKNDPRIKNILIPGECLQKRIRRLAGEIADGYKQKDIDFLVVLKGAMFFAADLSRALSEYKKNVRFHLIKTSVYSMEIKQSNDESREVKLELAPGDLRNRDIMLIEDITDQGFTMNWLMSYCTEEKKVGSLKICTLFDKILEKPSERVIKLREKIKIHHTGFYIPDVWIAGYGVDAAEDLRNLPFVASINQDHYRKKT